MTWIALDTNVLVKAFRDEDAASNALRGLLARRAAAGTRFAVPLFCVGEFWRVATDKRGQRPVAPAFVLAWVDQLVTRGAEVLTPGPQYWPMLRTLLAESLPIGTDVFDCQIAALCQEHGLAEIWTFDRSFVPHSQLRIVNPLTLPDAG